MTVASITNQRQKDAGSDYIPGNLDAEFALLGILLYENESIDEVADQLAPEHFFEPFHGRLYKRMLHAHRVGLSFQAMALHEEVRRDPVYIELGSARFLSDLIEHCPPPSAIKSYARIIIDIYKRRRLIDLGKQIQDAARDLSDADGEAVDVQSIIDSTEAELLDVSRTDPRLIITSLGDAADDVTDYVDDKTNATGIETGVLGLHSILGPLLPAELYLLPGRPGMGKSAVACNIAARVAAPEWWYQIERRDNQSAFDAADELRQTFGLKAPEPVGVLYASTEMNASQVTRRIICDVGFAIYGSDFPSMTNIRTKAVSEVQRRMMDEVKAIIRGWPIEIFKRSGMTITTLRSIARRQFMTWQRQGVKPGLVIVDHPGLMQPDGRSRGRYDDQTEIANGLQTMTDDLQVPFLVPLQVNREVDKRVGNRPLIADLRDAGAWEQNADAIIFPFRDSYYAQKEPEPNANEDNGIKWAEWSKRCASMEIEFIPGKVREGKAGRSAMAWIDVEWNALRSSEPSVKGRII